MKNCIFCQIVAGEIPCYKVYEDKDFFGFLDIRPLNPGHCLVVPKKHYRWVDDVSNFGEFFEAARKISLAIKESLKTEAINYVTAGFGVPHAHIHVIPRFPDDGGGEILTSKDAKNIPDQEMRKIAEKIRKRVKI